MEGMSEWTQHKYKLFMICGIISPNDNFHVHTATLSIQLSKQHAARHGSWSKWPNYFLLPVWPWATNPTSPTIILTAKTWLPPTHSCTEQGDQLLPCRTPAAGQGSCACAPQPGAVGLCQLTAAGQPRQLEGTGQPDFLAGHCLTAFYDFLLQLIHRNKTFPITSGVGTWC